MAPSAAGGTAADASREPVLVTRGLSKSYRTGHIIQGRRPALVDLDLEMLARRDLRLPGSERVREDHDPQDADGSRPPRPRRGRSSASRSPTRAWRDRVGYLPEQPVPLRLPDRRASTSSTPAACSGCAATRRRRARARAAGAGRPRRARRTCRCGASRRACCSASGLAQALINDPELVFLDEPMSGLDPVGRRLVRDLILDLEGRGQDRVLLDPHPLRRRDAVRPRGGAARRAAARRGARSARSSARRRPTWRCWSAG